MPKQIFINYRKAEGGREAKSLYHCLIRHFKKNRLFMDLTHLEGGQAWLDEIERHVADSFVMVALIGPDWINLKDEQATLRLSQPSDPVRYEIATALRRKVPVIPVLLDDAKLPGELELPIEMRGMLAWQAMPLRFGTFDEDAAKLALALKKHIPVKSAPVWAVGAGTAAGVFLGTAVGFAAAAWLVQAKGTLPDVQTLKTELMAVSERAKAAEDRLSQVSNSQQGQLGIDQTTITSFKLELAATEQRVRQDEERKRLQALNTLKADLEKANAALREAEGQKFARELEAAKRKAANDATELSNRDAALRQRDRELAELRLAQRTPTPQSPQDAVRAVQQKLHALGYYNGALDGVFGARLHRAMSVAYQAQGSALGFADNEPVAKFREALDRAAREPQTGLTALATVVASLVDRTTLPPATPVQRPTFEDINVSYVTREAPRDGSFPADGEHVQYRLNLKGPAFDRLVILDNSISLQQVELCKVPCADAVEDPRVKWTIARDTAEFQTLGGKFIFRTDLDRINTSGQKAKGASSDGYGEFDDVLWLRLTQRKNMPKSFAISLIYRRQ